MCPDVSIPAALVLGAIAGVVAVPAAVMSWYLLKPSRMRDVWTVAAIVFLAVTAGVSVAHLRESERRCVVVPVRVVAR